MKHIKKICLVAITAILSFGLISCKKDKSEKEDNNNTSLVALWEVKTVLSQNYYDGKLEDERTTDATGQQRYFHFLEDGRLQLVRVADDNEFQYKYNATTKEISITPNVIGDETLALRVKELTDTKLVLVFEETFADNSRLKSVSEFTCFKKIDFSN